MLLAMSVRATVVALIELALMLLVGMSWLGIQLRLLWRERWLERVALGEEPEWHVVEADEDTRVPAWLDHGAQPTHLLCHGRGGSAATYRSVESAVVASVALRHMNGIKADASEATIHP